MADPIFVLVYTRGGQYETMTKILFHYFQNQKKKPSNQVVIPSISYVSCLTTEHILNTGSQYQRFFDIFIVWEVIVGDDEIEHFSFHMLVKLIENFKVLQHRMGPTGNLYEN